MGTWGAGNLDSDTALDIVAERSAALIDGMMKRAETSESREADEYEHHLLLVELETVLALAGKGLIDQSTLPSTERLDALVDEWMAAWDEYYDRLAPKPEHKQQRRQVLRRTWRRLRQLCAREDA